MSDGTFYIWKEGAPSGPWSESEVRAKLAAGELSESSLANRDGAIQWTPLSELLKEAEPVNRGASLPATRAEAGDPVLHLFFNWALALLFVLGAVLALWFGLFFDPAQEGNSDAALNRRLTGVCGGVGLVLVVMLVKIYRLMKARAGGGTG